MPSALGQLPGSCRAIGIDSSAPTTAIGTIGTPARMAICDEPAPAEAAQPVALAVELAGALGALGEHQGELPLLAEQAVGVVGMGEHAAVA